MELQWRDADLLTVERRAPYINSFGKILHLHQQRRNPAREAVLAGGGMLHRASLSEAVLIKDNHLRLAGGVNEAVRRAKAGGIPVAAWSFYSPDFLASAGDVDGSSCGAGVQSPR